MSVHTFGMSSVGDQLRLSQAELNRRIRDAVRNGTLFGMPKNDISVDKRLLLVARRKRG